MELRLELTESCRAQCFAKIIEGCGSDCILLPLLEISRIYIRDLHVYCFTQGLYT